MHVKPRPTSPPSSLHGIRRITVAALAFIAGCAQVKPAADYNRTQNLVTETTGATELFNPEKPALSEQEIDAMLADGLSLKEAERIALLNSRELQAAVYDIGMANADWVQAGLLSNPLLIFSIQFPDGGGRSDLQATIAQNIVDLWQIPVKRQIASAARDTAILRIARQAGVLVADTRKAYYQSVASSELHRIALENLALYQRSADAIQPQSATTPATATAPATAPASDLDINLARAQVLSAQVNVQSARFEAADAKRRLATLLSLNQNMDAVELTDGLSVTIDTPLDAESLITIARDSRLDLKSLAANVDNAEAKLRLEWRQIVPEIWVGPFLEREEGRALPGRRILADTGRASIAGGALTAPDIESRGQRSQERQQDVTNVLGPSLTMPLPIFDQNQAQIAKAKLEYEKATKELEDQIIRTSQSIRSAVDRLLTVASIANLYEQQIIPQAEKNLESAHNSLTAGRTTILAMLEAQRTRLEAHRGQLAAQFDLATALASLEMTVGRPLTTTKNTPPNTPDKPPPQAQ